MVVDLKGYDVATHMYIGSQTFEVWQNFDPEFYNALTSQHDIGVATRKFYYIGLTLPDLLDADAQKGVRKLINHLYEHRDSTYYWIINGELTGPLYILTETRNQVQNLIQFNGPAPNTNLRKLREMALYARAQGWNPVQKALIYGAYMHVIQDLYGHMAVEPTRFGYGYAIEADSLMTDTLGLLYFGELYYESFSPTFLSGSDFDFMYDMYAWSSPTGWATGYFEFLGMYDVTGRYVSNYNWQNQSNIIPIQKFVEAANAVGYGTPFAYLRKIKIILTWLGYPPFYSFWL